MFSVPSYACQRRTTLDNHNTVLTVMSPSKHRYLMIYTQTLLTERLKMCFLLQDALSLLAENAELSDEDGRGVAFRRAAAVLKALPKPVTGVTQLRGLPCLGGHSLRVIRVSRKLISFLYPLYRTQRRSSDTFLFSVLVGYSGEWSIE